MAGGGVGGGAGEHAAVAYWYDACEDGSSLLCGIDFAASADFDPGLIPAMDSGVDDGFVAEIDRILESINAESAPAPPPPPLPPAPVAPPQPPTEQLQEAAAAVVNNAVAVVDAGQRSQGVEARKGLWRESHGGSANGGGGGEWRDGKRQRLASCGVGAPRHDWRLRPMPPPPSRGWDDRRGRRDFDRARKCDRDSHSGYEHHRREARGFWERDRGGKMVFRPSTWEQEADREAKRARTQDGSPMEKKAGADRTGAAQREKPVAEEQARQYQLEVHEQAKSRNTIAFLETGAGKTLIAVLLIKSVRDKMLNENKKMLAVFLVPKVPLVYQQAEVIRERTGYRVGHYCGEMGQDFWDARKWQREFESKQSSSRKLHQLMELVSTIRDVCSDITSGVCLGPVSATLVSVSATCSYQLRIRRLRLGNVALWLLSILGSCNLKIERITFRKIC